MILMRAHLVEVDWRLGSWEKFRNRLLSGASDDNIRFADLVGYLSHIGFDCRSSGSHQVFSRAGVVEIIVLQPGPGGSAKPYQVKQVRKLVQQYRLGAENDEI